MVVYFSGTGNSRWCARALAKQLGDEWVDAFHFIRDGIAADLVSGKPWVFVSPTYAWGLPKIFADFIRSGCFSGEKDAYFVMTCGGGIGGAAHYNRRLAEEKGLRYMGTCPVVMPDNYIVMFPSPTEEQVTEALSRAAPELERLAGLIAAGENFPEKKPGLGGRIVSGAVNSGFNRFYIRAKGFRATEACTSCGACAGLCPLGNISIVDGRPVWGDKCTHCMSCISRCPASAIEYGKRSVGKSRYVCPGSGD